MADKKAFLQKLLDMEAYFCNEEKSGNILRKCPKISEEARKEGNELYKQEGHDKQVHQYILLQYTKSIAFAPKGDEKLALGYSNRSALLMHLRRYEDCINDIDKALKITKSKQLKLKLDDRKTRCLALIEKSKVEEDSLVNSVKNLKLSDEEIVDTVFELPKIIKSKELLRVSNSVNLEYNKTYGRHLVANKDIKPGEIVIAEKSYACYSELDQIYLVCSHCLQAAWHGIPCDCCAYSIYCSESCKKAAWQEYHDVECNILPYVYTKTVTYGVAISLATRMFIKAVKAEGLDNVFREAKAAETNDNGIERFLSDISSGESKFGTCYNLQSSPNKRPYVYEHPLHESMIVYLLYKYTNIIYEKEKPNISSISDEKIFIIRDIFLKLGKIINSNQFCFQLGCTCPSIMDECESDCDTFRGHFIAPYCSLANHSCVPNVGMLCLPQQKVVLYANQPIKKNEQIFYSYGPLLDGVDGEIEHRQNFLLRHYYFTCQCPACKQNWQFIRDKSINKNDLAIYGKLLLEFQEILHNAKDFSRNQFLHNLANQWQLIDEVSLHQAFQLSELSYQYFENQSACQFSVRYKRYIRKALYILYGEKYEMLDCC